jgi:hydroxypyruvate isomerase
MSFHGLNTLEKVFKDRVAPLTVKTLIKYYGIDVEIYNIKNKILNNTFISSQSQNNKISSEVYQNNSLLQTDQYKYNSIDHNHDDYIQRSNRRWG